MHALQATAGNGAVSRLLGEGSPLPDEVRAEMEARFATRFADVRIHDDPLARSLASSLNARALTHGEDIAFGTAQYAPRSPAGKRLLAHELAHVLQQRRGGRAPRPGGGAFEAGLEADAERAADAACTTSEAAQVEGSGAPGVSMSPADSAERPAAAAEPDRTDVSGGSGWREWLTMVESMQRDERLGMHTAQAGDTLYAWTDQEYDERRANVRAYFMNRIGDIGTRADGLTEALGNIRGQETWYYKPLYQWLAWKNDIWFPEDAFEEEILTARTYAHQARITLAGKDASLIAAFDYLESARTSLETAVILLENYRDELLAASRSVAPMWGDAIDFTLGIIKGALAQVTDLADTAFWAADETRTARGGILQMAVTAPAMVPVALGHDVVKAAGAVDARGRVSTTSVLTKAVDSASAGVQQTFGSQFSDRYFFTAGEIGELAGALGFQGLLLYTGVKEVQLVFDVGGAISSFRTMFNTYRDNPNWHSDPNFWAGAIGTLLGVIGLDSWKGKHKAIQWIIHNGVFLNAAPAAWQLAEDLFNEDLTDEERRKRVAEDTRRLANILLLPIVQRQVQGGRSRAPDADPDTTPTGTRIDTSETDAPAEGAAAARDTRVESAQTAETMAAEGSTTREVGEDPLPNNSLPFRAGNAPRRDVAPEGELVHGPWKDARSADEDVPSATDEAAQPPMDLDVEAQLQMAVGYTPPAMESVGPVLIHDADAPVASASRRGRGGPQRPPGSPATPPPQRPAAPAAQPPRVLEALGRDRQLEVLREGKTLYTGQELPNPHPAEGQAARDETPGEQQARRDRIAPGPETDAVLQYMMDPRLARPLPDAADRAAAVENWKNRIAHEHRQRRWQQQLAESQKLIDTQRRAAAPAPEQAPAQQEEAAAPRGTILPEGFVPDPTIVPDRTDAARETSAPDRDAGRTLVPAGSASQRTIVPDQTPESAASKSEQDSAQGDIWDEFGAMEPDGFWMQRTGERTRVEDWPAPERFPEDEPTVEFDDLRRYPEDEPTEIIEREALSPDDEPTVEIDPDDVPTVEMARPVFDPDEEPTVSMQRPALAPDEEPTEPLVRALPAAQGVRTEPTAVSAMAEYEPTIEFADTTDEIVARPLEPVEATVEVERTDPGVADEAAAAAPEGPPAPAPAPPEPQATLPERAPAPPGVVPPDEHERARRRRRNRQPQ